MVDAFSKANLAILLEGLDIGAALLKAGECTPEKFRDFLLVQSAADRERIYDNLVSRRWTFDELLPIEDTLFPARQPSIPGSDAAWSESHSQRFATCLARRALSPQVWLQEHQ